MKQAFVAQLETVFQSKFLSPIWVKLTEIWTEYVIQSVWSPGFISVSR